MRFRSLVPTVLCMFFVTLVSGAAFADGSHDRTHFGHDITIGPNEKASEATCFGCSIHVRGSIEGDVATFGGDIVVEDDGVVGGDTTSFGGSVRLDKGAKVEAITLFGGHLRRDPAAIVGGDVTTFNGTAWLLLIFVLPLIFLGAVIALVIWLVRRMMRPPMPATA